MKLLIGPPFDQWRKNDPKTIAHYGSAGNETCGAFEVATPAGAMLLAIASGGLGWDHVSVSHPLRCPTWNEMQFVKRSFFRRGEWAFELHPPERENISLHNNCLHLWRPQFCEIPLPPREAVA